MKFRAEGQRGSEPVLAQQSYVDDAIEQLVDAINGMNDKIERLERDLEQERRLRLSKLNRY